MSRKVFTRIVLLSPLFAAFLWGCSAMKKSNPLTKKAQAEVSETSVTLLDPEDKSYRDEKSVPRYSIYNLPIQNQSGRYDMNHYHYGVNPTIDTHENAISTFSADVNTASWSLAKAYLTRGEMPDAAAIRVEEMLNAFDYPYQQAHQQLFSIQAEAFPSPHRRGYHVLQLGVQGKKAAKVSRKPANLVFLIDVSGSMAEQNRLELVKQSLGMLLNQLYDDDYVTVIAFNEKAWVALDPTPASDRHGINRALAALNPNGSTNVQDGLALAYAMMQSSYRGSYNNRIILASDGVANTGLTHAAEIFSTIENAASRGIHLTVVGVGLGNYNDHLLEQLARKGSGHYIYINDLTDAHRDFVKNIVGNIQLLAEDVKIQVEFDPNQVLRYRLLGYEKRSLRNRDFDNDRKDAAEIGAGHAVTAIYEVKFRSFQEPYFGRVSIRYKHPHKTHAEQINKRLPTTIIKSRLHQASSPSRLAYVVATFAEKLRSSYWVRNVSYAQLLNIYEDLPMPMRSLAQIRELGSLIEKARIIDTRADKYEAALPLSRMDFDSLPVLR